MGSLLNKKTTLLLVILLTSATLFINPTQARAKADFDDDDDDWTAWGDDEDTNDDGGIGGNENTNVEPKSIDSHDDHSDHSNHQHIHTAGVLNSAPEVPKQFDEGTQGANQAAFNESCSPTGKRCHNPNNLVCSATDGTGRCVCKEGYVYVRQTETCWVIPKSDQEPCSHDIQCHEGKWGRISRCNKGPARCECYDYSSNGRTPTVLVEGVCYIKKSVGDLCNFNEECNAPILGEAFCEPGDHSGAGGTYNGSCQCRGSYYWYNPLSECLLFPTKPGDACKVNEQCMKSTLGLKSRCDTTTATCLCGPPGPPPADGEKVKEYIFHESIGKCFEKKGYNDTCNEKDECIANLGPDVNCGATEFSEDRNICHCPAGTVCRASAFSVVPSSGIWIISVAVIVMTLAMNGVGVGLTSRG